MDAKWENTPKARGRKRSASRSPGAMPQRTSACRDRPPPAPAPPAALAGVVGKAEGGGTQRQAVGGSRAPGRCSEGPPLAAAAAHRGVGRGDEGQQLT